MQCIINNSIEYQSLVYKLNDQTVLFQTIQFSMSTHLNCFKYCYVALTIHLNTSQCLHLVKWSNSSISNNSILHKSFVYTQFKCQIVLFDQ